MDVHEDSDAFAIAFKNAFGDQSDFVQIHTIRHPPPPPGVPITHMQQLSDTIIIMAARRKKT